MAYVDGFVLPIAKKNLAAYKKMAKRASRIWREHGALEYRECVAEDFASPPMVSFMKLSGAKKGETVVIAWIVFKSRAHRDKVNAKVMADPRLCADMTPDKMPFDCKRMAYGGFDVLVEA